MPLQVQLLPTSLGDHSQTQSLTSFLINDTIAIDAGSLGFSLGGAQLANVGHVILTHSHLDHIASLPIAIAEVFPRLKRPMRIYATPGVLKAVQDHLLNGVIWPDFSRIKMLGSNNMALEFIPIEPRIPFDIDGIRFTPIPVNHEVPTIGLVAQAADATVVFTSDTCCTDDIWAAASTHSNLRAIFVDCSFPDEMEQLAIQSGHLTPRLVAAETAKLTRPAKIICVHIKPDTRDKVLAQLAAHHERQISPVEIGKKYLFNGVDNV
jgi:ribonuclease BN (tRNA processing enzyme)